jgi:lipopolysaccharide export system protein LptC
MSIRVSEGSVRLSHNELRCMKPSPHTTGVLGMFEDNLADARTSRPRVAVPRLGRMNDAGNSRAVHFDVTPAAWRGGFKEARRHSARVRVLRRAAIAGSAIAMALVLTMVLMNPLRLLPVDVSVKKVGLDGTKITVDFPKITGLQTNGRPYEIKARTGIEDVAVPDIIELQDLESSLGTAESSTTWVSAAHGVYDSSNDKLALDGDVRIKSSTGYDIWLKTARIDFKSGGLVSEEPVKVFLDGGAIEAKEMDVSDNGHKVSFDGDVTSTIENDEAEPGDGREMAENAQ